MNARTERPHDRIEQLRPVPPDPDSTRQDELRRAALYGLCERCGEPRNVQIIQRAVPGRPAAEYATGRGERIELYCPRCEAARST